MILVRRAVDDESTTCNGIANGFRREGLFHDANDMPVAAVADTPPRLPTLPTSTGSSAAREIAGIRGPNRCAAPEWFHRGPDHRRDVSGDGPTNMHVDGTTNRVTPRE